VTARAGLEFEVVDSHQHFVEVDRFSYYWMRSVPDILHRSFGPEQLETELSGAGVSATIAVQAHPSEAESMRLVELAKAHPFIRGVVASVDLADTRLEETLRRYRAIPAIRGVRHQQAEDGDARWFLQPAVMRGLEAVEKAGLCYDFLCRAHQLSSAAEVARAHPGLKFILEHAGKPPIKSAGFAAWASDLELLHGASNVCCKLSELTTQADVSSWGAADLQPYISHAAAVFGPSRTMWGSGWPICLLASSYYRTITVTLDCLRGAAAADPRRIFRDNAITWYGLGEGEKE